MLQLGSYKAGMTMLRSCNCAMVMPSALWIHAISAFARNDESSSYDTLLDTTHKPASTSPLPVAEERRGRAPPAAGALGLPAASFISEAPNPSVRHSCSDAFLASIPDYLTCRNLGPESKGAYLGRFGSLRKSKVVLVSLRRVTWALTATEVLA